MRKYHKLLSPGFLTGCCASYALVSVSCCPFDPTNPLNAGQSLSKIYNSHLNTIDFRAWSIDRKHKSAFEDEVSLATVAPRRRTKEVKYTNPVWSGYFADPFVLRVGDEYYAYGTADSQRDGRCIPVLRSQDLVHWQYVADALKPLDDPKAEVYWAPEVAQREGKFYMYYSTGGRAGEHHKIRVAVADKPEGPFVDQGRNLIANEAFSIDPHPFKDPRSGQWYLFFAKDFFDDRPGTAIAMVALGDDMISVKGAVKPVVRATADWQLYQHDRTWYNKTWPDWYTLEGPTVQFHDGKYYCLYSGGCWNSKHYGVGFAYADDITGPWVDDQDQTGASVLETVPEHVLGPGHNSVVIAPDGSEVMIYHAWDAALTARRMCVDPLIWTKKGPHCTASWQQNTLYALDRK